jgi:4-hydroxybenzoate polyprenyltransferase
MKKYFSLVTFSHSIFALPFALIGFFLAIKTYQVPVDWFLFVKMITCMLFARSAAMGFNRYADADIDVKNNRTANREIPAGIISRRNALIFILFNCLSFIVTTYFINSLCFYLSPVALLVVLGYSYCKRFTSLAHFVLGLGLSLAPIGAYLCVSEKFDWLPVLFSLTVLFWVSGFDIIYALQDEEFDRAEKLFSIPVLLGKIRALQLSSFVHVASAMFIIVAGLIGEFSWLYWIGVIFFSSLLIYQHTLVKPNDLSKVNRAFFTTNGFASIAFAIFVLSDLYFAQ